MTTTKHPMAKVLLVDDDAELATMLAEYLSLEGFEPAVVHDGESGVEQALRPDVDAVVLDVMLPGIGGVEVLRRIRARSQVPVVMLTARGDHVDRIVGLELGADDYVPKPCPPREIVARLRAILRRGRQWGTDARDDDAREGRHEAGARGDHRSDDRNEPRLEAGPLVLWPTRRRATCNGETLTLTSTEFNLLEALMRGFGAAVPKQDLYERALGRPMQRFERSIDVHISSIRQKLAQFAGDSCRIESVRGIGYQLVGWREEEGSPRGRPGAEG